MNYDSQHTTEPRYSFDIVDLEEQPEKKSDWRYSEVTMRYAAQCDYCGGCIESNDPEDEWFHV